MRVLISFSSWAACEAAFWTPTGGCLGSALAPMYSVPPFVLAMAQTSAMIA